VIFPTCRLLIILPFYYYYLGLILASLDDRDLHKCKGVMHGGHDITMEERSKLLKQDIEEILVLEKVSGWVYARKL